MSVARSSECLFCLFSRSFRPSSIARRQFHSSPIQQKRKPRFASVKATANQLDINRIAKEFPSENGAIPQQYSPEQRAAIEAAQKLIDPEKLEKQTGMRTDPWRMKYFDDMTKLDPVVDKSVKQPWTNIDDHSRLKTEDELEEDLVRFMKSLPDTDDDGALTQEMWDNFDKNQRLTVGREEAELRPRTALAPDLPKIPTVAQQKIKKRRTSKNGEPLDEQAPSPALVQLMQMTGYNQKQISALRVKTILMHRVVNQTRLGKIQKIYCLSVAGNGNGLIGIGEGKAAEGGDSILQSQYRAIRNMTPILRYEDRTIFGDVNGKVSATELELYARPPGFGLRCQQYIWEICKCAGIHDLAAKVTRSRNPMNTVKAAVQALLSQKHPEDIARARGKKLVDVRKVYYAGMT
ncbi:uncharacterized protein Z518_10904 [Rhinocladiella mackenziei CBS 650.93]|uniref:Small ribosomal subunit protein uS5m n=1 Tax=Rhinocladiella mackenziei CBS 650.93 TaxID=1442369 RepID=A0A0D2FD17_9EURO|nr:uncharacterized protein Z518_10904 [Rhinocladiella mackenziei CBS 650.93]KIW99976.1 hypothetical protein Z518_10904 [Rhinocladiella mackenziei CBS 650.93]